MQVSQAPDQVKFSSREKTMASKNEPCVQVKVSRGRLVTQSPAQETEILAIRGNY